MWYSIEEDPEDDEHVIRCERLGCGWGTLVVGHETALAEYHRHEALAHPEVAHPRGHRVTLCTEG